MVFLVLGEGGREGGWKRHMSNEAACVEYCGHYGTTGLREVL